MALLAVAIAALALAALPAAVGLAIMIGSTLPLEFAAAAVLAILTAIKLGAVAAGLAAAIRSQGRPPRTTLIGHLDLSKPAAPPALQRR